MDMLPWHPRLVHLPIALGVLMPGVAGGVLLAWWRGLFPRRTWVIVVALQVVLVGSGIVAMRTGEADEERVERVVPEEAIEAHEDAAKGFVWVAAAVWLVMLVAVVLPDERAARVVAALAVAGTVVVLVLGYRAGEAGGRLVYEHGAARVFAPQAGTAEESHED